MPRADPLLHLDLNANTVLVGQPLEFLENEKARVDKALDNLDLALRVLEPLPFAPTLPQPLIIVRDDEEMLQMTEADLLQELTNVKAGLSRISRSLGSEEKESLDLDISELAHELLHVSQRDVSPEEEDDTMYCICCLPYNGARMMIQCDTCEDWYVDTHIEIPSGAISYVHFFPYRFHITCVGIPYADVAETEEYECPICQSKCRFVCLFSISIGSSLSKSILLIDSISLCIASRDSDDELAGHYWLGDNLNDIVADVDPVLCRKGEKWAQREVDAVSAELSRINGDIKRVDAAIRRAKNRILAQQKEQEAAAEEARKQALKKKRAEQRRAKKVAAANAAAENGPAKDSPKLSNARSALPEDLRGEALSKEIHRILSTFGITQAQVVVESQLPGGALSLSALLHGRDVPRKAEKEDVLRQWLEQVYSRIDSKELLPRPPSRKPAVAKTRYVVGQEYDARDADGVWHVVKCVALGKGRVKIHWDIENRRDGWLGIKGGRLKPLGTHTAAAADNTQKRPRDEEAAVRID